MTSGLRVHQLPIAPETKTSFSFLEKAYHREIFRSPLYALSGCFSYEAFRRATLTMFLNVLRFCSMLFDVRIYRTLEHRCDKVPSIDQLKSPCWILTRFVAALWRSKSISVFYSDKYEATPVYTIYI